MPRRSPSHKALQQRPWWSGRKFWLSLSCSAVFLGLAVQQVDWGRTVVTLQETNWSLLGLGTGGIVATYVVFAVRWRVLLSNTVRVPVQHTFVYIMIGYLANAVLPLRLGEVARAVLLGKRHGISTSLVLGSVVLERALDVCIVLLLALGVTWLRDMPPVVRTGIDAFASIGLVTLVSLVLLACTGTRFFGWLSTVSVLVPGLPIERLAGAVRRFAEGLHTLRHGRQLGVALLLSVSAWALAGAATIAYVVAFHLPVPWYAGLFVLAVINLGTAIPSSPGAIGVYHYAAVLALSAWGTEKSMALGFALGTHGISVLLNIVLGGGCLAKEGLALHSLALAIAPTSPAAS